MNLLLYYSLSLYLSLSQVSAAPEPAAPKPSDEPVACTVTSAKSQSIFDLRRLNLIPPAQSKSKHPRQQSWNATGHDYGANFTMNICGPVIEDIKDVSGVKESLWKNVSAYYTYKGEVFSIGQQNDWPLLRGRKLVLNYTNGSPCEDGHPRRSEDELDDTLQSRSNLQPRKAGDDVRRKNAVISLLCDKDRDISLPPLSLSLVGWSPDHCSYFFEGRSNYACAHVDGAKQTLSPAGVFGIIVLIAVLVYVIGGVVYSRMVLQQRGWRQCPNFNLWSGMFSFFGDIFVILTSSCSRCLPSRRGYSRVNGNNASRGGRGRDSDAENRLIDELNEEWDD